MTGVDKVPFGYDGIFLDVVSDAIIVKFSIVDAVIIGFDKADKMFADKAVEKHAKHILLEIPVADCATDIIGDLPDLALQGRALLLSVMVYPVSIGFKCAGFLAPTLLRGNVYLTHHCRQTSQSSLCGNIYLF